MNTEHFVYQGKILFHVMSLNQGINKTIMNKMINQLFEGISVYSKLLLTRIEVHSYSDTENNQIISKFRSNILKILSKRYHSQAWFFWVREQTEFADKAHYHCYALTNGNKASAGGIWKSVEQAMFLQPDIYCSLPENSSYLIRRNETKALTTAVYRISYMAKNYSKERTPFKVKKYQTSTLKYDQKR